MDRSKFDEKYYLDKYEDVKDSGIDPWVHYITYGEKENRFYSLENELASQLSARFDAKYYLKRYPAVLESGMDAWKHYLRYGHREGRYISLDDEIEKTFDEEFYLCAYPDVRKSKIKPIDHYKKYGMKEGRLRCINYEQVEIIKNSSYFDSEWYVKYYYNVKNSRLDPAVDYLVNGISGNRNPGPCFNSKEYLMINPDVKAHKMNPLVHYEKTGYAENRVIQLTDSKPMAFPPEAEDVCECFGEREFFDKKIISIFAIFSGNGEISRNCVYMLHELKKVSDYIVVVADNPIFSSEISKISSMANACLFKRHGEYDFGSYKRGYHWVVNQKVLCEEDSLLLVNDSCFGPINGFDYIIDDYNEKKCDFYGLSVGKYPIPYIQSFFYIFSEKVYKSAIFERFMNSIKAEMSAAHVVFNYEFKLTNILSDYGFTYGTLVDKDAFTLNPNSLGIVPTKYTLTLLKEYKYPFIKVKVLKGSSVENPQDIIDYVKINNEDLWEIIIDSLEKSSVKKRVVRIDKYCLYDKYRKHLSSVANTGRKPKIVFLVNMSSMFPGEELMKMMLREDKFDVSLYVIPDTRFGEKEMISSLAETFLELKLKYSFAKIAVDVLNEKIVEYKDVVKFADIVCYPSPYDLSYSIYNPSYAAEKGIPSIHLNYGFYRSKYDRKTYAMDNYNNFWKVFLESSINLEEYINFGYCEGANAYVSGYSKMDSLFEYMKQAKHNTRKKIILAPHHSVSGGTNELLALSNFEKYADLFLELPKQYPDIDFIFRPHPVLFTVLKRKNMWGEEKVCRYIQKMTSYPNVEYSVEGDYLKTFAESDGIIQDCGSFLVEYMYTGKPCCYMLKSPDDIEEKFSEVGQRCLENCYIAYDDVAIKDFLDNVILSGADYKKNKRDEFAKKYVMVNFPNATQRVYEHLCEQIWNQNNSEMDTAGTIEKNADDEKRTYETDAALLEKLELIIKENESLGALSLSRLRELNAQKEEFKQTVAGYEQKLLEEREQKDSIENRYEQLVSSKSWIITKPLRILYWFICGGRKNK